MTPEMLLSVFLGPLTALLGVVFTETAPLLVQGLQAHRVGRRLSHPAQRKLR